MISALFALPDVAAQCSGVLRSSSSLRAVEAAPTERRYRVDSIEPLSAATIRGVRRFRDASR